MAAGGCESESTVRLLHVLACLRHLGHDGISRAVHFFAFACGELHDRAELDLVGHIGLRGPAITGGERQRDAIAMALDQLELRLELDTLNEPAATFGYDSAERGGDHPPIGDAHLYFEIVALAERNFLVLLNLVQTPVIGAAIFEL